MGLLCKIRGHRAASPEVMNDGLYFSTCTSCGLEILRQKGGRWHLPPRGFRVSWKPEGKHAIAPHKAINLAHEQRR